MKKSVLFIALFIGAISIINAQEGTTRGNRAGTQTDATSTIDRRVADLTERLSLTTAQVSQVRAIYEKTMGTASQGDATSNSEQRHNEIMALLNADQKKIYEAYLNERENPSGSSETGQARQQMDVSAIIDGRVEDLTERLTLTTAQVAQVRAIYEKTLGAGSQGNTTASSEQRHNEIMQLLNAEQKKIYQAYLDEREQPAR